MLCMSETLKVVLALLFVTVLGWVLLQPVFDAVEEDPIGTRNREDSTPDVVIPATSPPADEADAAAELPDEFRSRPLAASYPKRCLREVEATGDVVAVERGNVIAAGSLDRSLSEYDGTRLFGIGVGGRVAWLDGERGAYVGAPGSRRIRALPAARAVVWSPIADCALVVTDGGAILALPGEAPLVEDEVASVAFSPDGRKIAVVMKEEQAASVWIGSLSGDGLREVMRDRRSIDIELQGWAPDGRTVYMTWPDGGMTFVTTSEPPQSAGISVRPAEAVEQCGNRLLAIIDGRVAEITRRGPDYLTDAREGYLYLSCSPDGDFIAAIASYGLVLLDADGAFLRDLTEDTGYTDVFVDWGRPGAGVIFGRVRSDPDAAELWHIAEGGGARATGITYRGGPDAVEWGASPPTGLP